MDFGLFGKLDELLCLRIHNNLGDIKMYNSGDTLLNSLTIHKSLPYGLKESLYCEVMIENKLYTENHPWNSVPVYLESLLTSALGIPPRGGKATCSGSIPINESILTAYRLPSSL